VDHSASFQFFGQLTELLVRPHEAGGVIYRFNEHPAVKDAIEALGIPHTEVDVIAVNGQSVAFSYQLQPNDRIDVYPFGWPVRYDPEIRLIPPVFDAPRFILDVHLGKLARRLRLLGFDCLYRNNYADDDIVRIALEDDRIILTRDRGLLKRKRVEQGCLLNSDWPDEQLDAANQRYGLIERINPLGRCPSCNGLLQPVEKEQVADRLQPKTLLYYKTFRLCTDCGQVYWRGSHTERILRWIENFSRSG